MTQPAVRIIRHGDDRKGGHVTVIVGRERATLTIGEFSRLVAMPAREKAVDAARVGKGEVWS